MLIAAASAANAATLNPEDGAVLPASEAQKLIHQCSRMGPQGVTDMWRPEPSQIRDLEIGLPKKLKDQPKNTNRSVDIVRQYAGFILEKRKVIYVNALPRQEVVPQTPGEPPIDWRNKAVVVCDGGPQFFGVEYDPGTKLFSNFAFNGPAR